MRRSVLESSYRGTFCTSAIHSPPVSQPMSAIGAVSFKLSTTLNALGNIQPFGALSFRIEKQVTDWQKTGRVMSELLNLLFQPNDQSASAQDFTMVQVG